MAIDVVEEQLNLDDGFQGQIRRLQTLGSLMLGGLTGAGQISWMTPEPGEWTGAHRDVSGMSKAFDRADLNTSYRDSMADADKKASVGEVGAIKLQVDYVGVLERAYRARSASGVRCLVHAAARFRGHNHDNGVFSAGTLGYIQDMMKAGRTQDRRETP